MQLIQYTLDSTGEDLPTCVRLALGKVIGAYAIVVIDRENPDTLIAARNSGFSIFSISSCNSAISISPYPCAASSDVNVSRMIANFVG